MAGPGECPAKSHTEGEYIQVAGNFFEIVKHHTPYNSFQIRHILSNGSLYFPPFEAEAFRQDVHWATYKCISSNTIGTIVSRDISVKAGIMLVQLRVNFKNISVVEKESQQARAL